MILVLTGKSACGKDTIKNELISNSEFTGITTCTTRPRRKGERKNAYHFLGYKKFMNKLIHREFFETTYYNVANGEICYYGTLKKDIFNAEDNSVIIMNPDGVKKLEEYKELRERCVVCLIEADQDTIQARLQLRGDDEEEAARRINADSKDFADFIGYDFVVTSSNDKKIEDTVKEVICGFQEFIEQ